MLFEYKLSLNIQTRKIRYVSLFLETKQQCFISTRRERLKSALCLRLKKRKTFFFGKKLEIFEKKISFEKCRTVPKNGQKMGTLFDL